MSVTPFIFRVSAHAEWTVECDALTARTIVSAWGDDNDCMAVSDETLCEGKDEGAGRVYTVVVSDEDGRRGRGGSGH